MPCVYQPALSCSRIPPSNAQTGGAPIDRGGIKDGEARFGPIAKPNEAATKPVDGPLAPASRVGFAIVALGRLSVEQILPAFAQTKKCKLSALVSGSPGKLEVLGSQYGLPKSSLYSYDNLEQLKENEDVRVVYIVLPNSLHKEFVLQTAAIKNISFAKSRWRRPRLMPSPWLMPARPQV
jgi:hypothetical protein